MLNGKNRRHLVFASLAFALAAAGCDDKLQTLQFQKDLARDRDWVLTADGVTVLDLDSRRKVAQIPLPGWIWAGAPHGCTPALALGPKGEALVSSDVVPVLWRIDPDTLAVTKHNLRLDDRSGKDIGFSGLSYSAQKTAYVAVACGQGSVWRVDLSLEKAAQVSIWPEGELAWTK
jgi:hypothetical protein